MSDNKVCFNMEEMLAPRRNTQLDYHTLANICDCLRNIFTATLHTASHSSIRNLRRHNAVVTGTDLSQKIFNI